MAGKSKGISKFGAFKLKEPVSSFNLKAPNFVSSFNLKAPNFDMPYLFPGPCSKYTRFVSGAFITLLLRVLFKLLLLLTSFVVC